MLIPITLTPAHSAATGCYVPIKMYKKTLNKKTKKTKITPQQKDVIESSVDIKRVLACAGSGKTFVLTQSIIELLGKQACRPDEILAITFTRNAAENMRQNIRDKLSKNIDFEHFDIFGLVANNAYMAAFGAYLDPLAYFNLLAPEVLWGTPPFPYVF